MFNFKDIFTKIIPQKELYEGKQQPIVLKEVNNKVNSLNIESLYNNWCKCNNSEPIFYNKGVSECPLCGKINGMEL